MIEKATAIRIAEALERQAAALERIATALEHDESVTIGVPTLLRDDCPTDAVGTFRLPVEATDLSPDRSGFWDVKGR